MLLQFVGRVIARRGCVVGLRQKTFNDFHPIGRIGKTSDVASVIVFLLSDAASWVTGAIWNVDGGVMAGRNQ
jgi:NAD(P)-dependent dehydrogenase (short-subunit alcohol dehydrogenase family)